MKKYFIMGIFFSLMFLFVENVDAAAVQKITLNPQTCASHGFIWLPSGMCWAPPGACNNAQNATNIVRGGAYAACGGGAYTCASGSALNTTNDGYSYIWSCATYVGGQKVNQVNGCSSVIPVWGSCGGAANTCASGSGAYYGNDGYSYTWYCLGRGGGGNAYCSKVIPVSGSCSTTAYQCTAGSPNNGGNNGTSYTWSCDGRGGGSTAWCSSLIPVTCPVGQNWNGSSCIACTGGKTWNGSSCVCPATLPSWNGSSCVACQGNQTWNGSSCVCPATLPSWNGSSCIACTGGKTWNGSSCVCPATLPSWNGSTCTTSNQPKNPTPGLTFTNDKNASPDNSTNGALKINIILNPTIVNSGDKCAANAEILSGSIRDYTCSVINIVNNSTVTDANAGLNGFQVNPGGEYKVRCTNTVGTIVESASKKCILNPSVIEI
jgi:hypothetical protein